MMEIRKGRVAIIKIENSSPKIVKTIFKALKPELQANSSDSRVEIKADENSITLHFESKSIAILRALINSYLRWILTLKNIVGICEDLKDSKL